MALVFLPAMNDNEPLHVLCYMQRNRSHRSETCLCRHRSRTYNLDVPRKKLYTPRTRAIMPVHLYGQCAEIDPLLAIGERHQLPLFRLLPGVWAARTMGVELVHWETGCFSFYPTKNLVAPAMAEWLTTMAAGWRIGETTTRPMAPQMNIITVRLVLTQARHITGRHIAVKLNT